MSEYTPEQMFALYNAATVMGFYEEADTWADRLRALGVDIPVREPFPPAVGLLNSEQE